jgi:exodeoxyribonuclease V gamma subunit
MRSIPFKVIAFLGMNSNDYPRQETPLGFDLMAKKPKKGDRNSKANDKYLFLEALLSTEKVFYLSYKGRSTKDNSHKEPSILIDELMNYVQQKSMIENVSQILITEHPLHGFSEQL